MSDTIEPCLNFVGLSLRRKNNYTGCDDHLPSKDGLLLLPKPGKSKDVQLKMSHEDKGKFVEYSTTKYASLPNQIQNV